MISVNAPDWLVLRIKENFVKGLAPDDEIICDIDRVIRGVADDIWVLLFPPERV